MFVKASKKCMRKKVIEILKSQEPIVNTFSHDVLSRNVISFFPAGGRSSTAAGF
jgi:hypothetical protein